ncbi:MAG TPA: DUF349 domain-containing protein, partial [Adhaeribacter sp.]|nr:DUF349 domain-containing protein [Adhaeribacter sp.]
DFFEDKQAMLNRTIDKYKDLITRSEALKESEEWDETTVKLKQLQDEWKTIGGTLPRKLSNELWTTFRAAHNHFFNRLKNKISQTKVESKDKYMEDNLSRKKDLVTQAENLLGLPSQEATSKAKELQAAWKKVGPVKGPESDEVWNQFTNACDRIFELSSLEHFMRKKGVPADNPITEEQATARISALRDFIKSDKLELEVLEENLGKLNPNPNNETFRTMLEGKIRTFNRKINTKTTLIELFKSKITANQETK